MIVVVVGLFQKTEDNQHKAHVTSHICYDAESVDDAKRDFFSTDYFLKTMNDGYSLCLVHVQVADVYKIVEACEEAAKASFNLILEAATKAKESQEGEE